MMLPQITLILQCVFQRHQRNRLTNPQKNVKAKKLSAKSFVISKNELDLLY